MSCRHMPALLLFVCWWVWAPCESCRTVTSSSLQWLLVPTKEKYLHKGWVHVTPVCSTQHCQEPSKKWPKSNWSCLTGNKTIRDKHPNHPHMKVSVRAGRGAEMQRKFMGIRNELWGGQPCSRVNFTEGPKQKQKPHTHTGQIPISSLHILSTNVNLELIKRTWSKSYWFWDSLKGINPWLMEIK